MIELMPNYWPSKGHFNINQYNFIKNLVENVNIEYAIETGFCTGRSALSILNNCLKLKKLISIDRDFDYENWGGRDMVNLLEEKFNSFKAIEDYSSNVLTKKFFEDNYPKGIDFASIDGDHSYEGCKKDLGQILPHLNSDGIIVIDDYMSGPPDGCSLPEVTSACDDFYYENKDLISKEKWYKRGKGFCIFRKK